MWLLNKKVKYADAGVKRVHQCNSSRSVVHQ